MSVRASHASAKSEAEQRRAMAIAVATEMATEGMTLKQVTGELADLGLDHSLPPAELQQLVEHTKPTDQGRQKESEWNYRLPRGRSGTKSFVRILGLLVALAGVYFITFGIGGVTPIKLSVTAICFGSILFFFPNLAHERLD